MPRYNQRIQVFELNGKFLGNCETEGTNLGEFICPRSAAILKNGRIGGCIGLW